MYMLPTSMRDSMESTAHETLNFDKIPFKPIQLSTAATTSVTPSGIYNATEEKLGVERWQWFNSNDFAIQVLKNAPFTSYYWQHSYRISLFRENTFEKNGLWMWKMCLYEKAAAYCSAFQRHQVKCTVNSRLSFLPKVPIDDIEVKGYIQHVF